MKPIIGILAEVDGELCARVRRAYVGAVEGAGGVPILLPYVRDGEIVKRFVGVCDGLLFTGGGDIDPRRYGEELRVACEPEALRDELEFKAFFEARSASKPILAICRGAQVVNVALGGTLYQDIPTEINTEIAHAQSEPTFSPSHSVTVLEGTPLSELTGRSVIRANSFHHQAIKALGAGLEIMAVADDGIIEAAYSTGKQYIRAYQWHPERLYAKDEHSRMIFEDFIRACKSERDG